MLDTGMNINIAHVNVRSLIANFGPFREYVLNQGYGVAAVTETWLGNTIDDAAVGIDNYKFFKVNRLVRRGGGVGIYVKNNIKCEILLSESLDFIEHMWVKLFLSTKTIILGVIYRPPNTDIGIFFNYLEDMLYNIYSPVSH